MRFFGHPIHPAIVHFPIACWVLAALADGAAIYLGDPFFLRAAYWLHGAGLSAGSLAAIAGFADLGGLKERSEASTTAMLHVSFVLAAFSASAASFLGRGKMEIALEGAILWPQWASFAAGGLVLIGGYFGGTLVYRFGMGRAP